MKVSALAKATMSLAVASLTFAATAQAEQPPWVTVRSISYAGSGCPAGSVAENLSPDFTAFTLLFDSYIAEAGPGVSIREKRKNCQVNVDLNFPSGWSYSIIDVDYRGYVFLDRGTTGEQVSTYYFQGSRNSLPLKSTFRGPMDRDYHIRDTLGIDALVWSPCGATRSLNINTQVRVNANRNQQALMTLDSIDGQLTHIYGIQWRRCR